MTYDYSQSILEAVQLLIDNNNKQLKFDKTIICEVYKQRDLSIGEYQVKFEDNIFNVYVEDVTIIYNVGDTVYVLVPEGDMSNRKSIIGKTNNTPSFTVGYNYELTSKSSNLIPNNSQEFIVGTKVNSLNSIVYENQLGNTGNYLISDLSKKYEIIRISADFLTINTSKDNLDNYGLVIEFLAADNNTIITYWLDINNFLGNPYLLSEFTNQYIDIEVVKGSIANINKIYLSAIPNKQDTKNLFTIKAKNIKVEFMELIDYNEQLYYTNIKPLNGIENNKSQDLTLQAVAKYCGSNILTKESCKVNWYEKDIEGWKLIENQLKKDSSLNISQIHFNFDKLIIPQETVWSSKEIKVEIIYNNKTILESFIIVYENLATDQNQELITTIDSNGNTCLQAPIQNSSYSYFWTAETLDGKIHRLNSSEKTYTQQLTNELLSQAQITINCKIVNDNRFIVLSKTLTNMTDKGDLYVEFVGETRFEYDDKGAKSYDEAEKIRTIKPILVWADKKAGYCDIKWQLGELNKTPVYTLSSETPQNLQDSMFSEIWIDKNNIVQFKLNKKFEPNKKNNILTLLVTATNGKEYNYICPFEFIKIGDQEALGTNFQTVIKMNENNYLEALVFEDDTPFVNKNGIYTTEHYVADEYIWSIQSQIFDLKQDANNKNKVYILQKEKMPQEITDYSTVISVQVGITETMDINQNNQLDKIYCYYNYPAIIKVSESGDKYEIVSEEYFKQSQYLTNLTFPLQVYYTQGNNPVSSITKNFALGYIYEPTIYYYDLRLTKNLGIIKPSQVKDRYNYIPPKTFDYTQGTECLEVGVLDGNDNFETKYYITIMLQNSVKGLENVNGYNGTTLEGTKEPVIDEETQTIKKDPSTQEELYVPSQVHNLQLGVGELTNGEFTGVVMGIVEEKQKEAETTKKIGGLYGYDKGINTFGLTQEGKAYFGPKGKGRIEIDGTQAKIIGGGGGYQKNGMTIDLYGGDLETIIDKEGNETKTYKNYAINVNKEAFCVDYNGNGHVSGFAFDENGLYTAASIPQEDGTYKIDFPKSANEAFNYYPESTIIHESLGIRAPGMYFSDPYNKQMLVGSLGAGKGMSGSDPTNTFNFSSSRGIRIFASGEETSNNNDQTSKDIAIISKKGTIWLQSANYTISLDQLIDRIEALESRPVVPIV